jgi:hypothetical protein
MAYQRRTVWASASPLTASDLNAEFDAIAAGIAEINSELIASASSAIVINAADPAYNPTGNGSRASRVAEAIQAAVSGQRKVVWVPRFMWGYQEDAEWSAGIFEPTVLMVREGALTRDHDPIAYGSKVNDDGYNDTLVLNVCVAQAQVAANPGSAKVAITVPGEYQLNGNVTIPDVVALEERSGVTFAGAGEIIGLGFPYVLVEGTADTSVAGTSSGTVLATVAGVDARDYLVDTFRFKAGVSADPFSVDRQWIYNGYSTIFDPDENERVSVWLAQVTDAESMDQFQVTMLCRNQNVGAQTFRLQYQLLLRKRPFNFFDGFPDA